MCSWKEIDIARGRACFPSFPLAAGQERHCGWPQDILPELGKREGEREKGVDILLRCAEEDNYQENLYLPRSGVFSTET